MDKKDYYDILDIEPDATQKQIKEAWKKKIEFYHPDQYQDNEKKRMYAEDRTKDINEAYQVLSDLQERAIYDEVRKSAKKEAPSGTPSTTPKPEPFVDKKKIVFKNLEPGTIKSVSFILDNQGGPCEELRYETSDPWIRVIKGEPITNNSGFPYEVTIEVEGDDWSTHYSGYVTFWLDEEEVKVKVELHTKPKPVVKPELSYEPSPPSPPPPLPYSSYIMHFDDDTDDTEPIPSFIDLSKKRTLLYSLIALCVIVITGVIIGQWVNSYVKTEKVKKRESVIRSVEEVYGKNENILYSDDAKERLLDREFLVVEYKVEEDIYGKSGLYLISTSEIESGVSAENQIIPKHKIDINYLCELNRLDKVLGYINVDQLPDGRYMVHFWKDKPSI